MPRPIEATEAVPKYTHETAPKTPGALAFLKSAWKDYDGSDCDENVGHDELVLIDYAIAKIARLTAEQSRLRVDNDVLKAALNEIGEKEFAASGYNLPQMIRLSSVILPEMRETIQRLTAERDALKPALKVAVPYMADFVNIYCGSLRGSQSDRNQLVAELKNVSDALTVHKAE